MIQLSELPRSSCSKYPFMFKLFAKFLVLKVSEVRLQAGNRANTLPSLLQIFLNNEPVAKASLHHNCLSSRPFGKAIC